MSESIHPALTPEREAFRQRFAVRLITEKEEGNDLSRLPEGVYGYTSAPGANELPVFLKPIYRCFEVHRTAGGDIQYVGYLTEKEYQAFQAGAEPVVVNLYPEPHGESGKLVAIPLSRIDRTKPPSRDEGNWLRLEIAPKAEFLGLSHHAN
jgi:hypothetical protein